MTGASPHVRGSYWLDGPACGFRRFSIGVGRRAAEGLSRRGEVHCVTGGCRGLWSRGCLVAIRRHIHGVLTLAGARGSRRGEW